MDRVDELLIDWYEWSQGYGLPLDYGSADPACRDFPISCQWWDDYEALNEQVEAQLREYIGRRVEPLVLMLDTRLRVAVNAAMRNYRMGNTQWLNARPASAVAVDYVEAKAWLGQRFVAIGLLRREECLVHGTLVLARIT